MSPGHGMERLAGVPDINLYVLCHASLEREKIVIAPYTSVGWVFQFPRKKPEMQAQSHDRQIESDLFSAALRWDSTLPSTWQRTSTLGL
jgi:hypothetical protein